MRRKFYNRIMAVTLTAAMLFGTAPVITPAAEAEVSANEAAAEITDIEPEADAEEDFEADLSEGTDAEPEENELPDEEETTDEEEITDEEETTDEEASTDSSERDFADDVISDGPEEELQMEEVEEAEEKQQEPEGTDEKFTAGNADGAAQSNLDFVYRVEEWNGEKVVRIVEYIGTATEVVIPSTIEGYPVRLVDDTGFREKKVVSITLPNTLTMGFTFWSCLKNVVFAEGTERIPSKILFYSDIESVTIPDSVKEIGSCAFCGCSKLKEVRLPSELEWIGDGAFSGAGITSIVIPKKVRYIGRGALKAGNLESVVMEYNDTILETEKDGAYRYQCEIADEAFAWCNKLVNVELSENVVKIGSDVFLNCRSLTALKLPESIKTIGSDFITYTSIQSITVPKNLVGAQYAFNGAESLESVIFEEGIKKIPEYICAVSSVYVSNICSVSVPDTVTEIGAGAFMYCRKLPSLEFSDNVRKIEHNAYTGCTGLTSVKIGKANYRMEPKAYNLEAWQNQDKGSEISVSLGLSFNDCVFIRSEAFKDCTSLREVAISGNVSDIESNAFSGCSLIQKVHYYGMEAEWDRISISSAGNTALVLAPREYGKKWEKMESGYEVACATELQDLYRNENIEFVENQQEVSPQFSYKPREKGKFYYMRVRKCTKYPDSGKIMYGAWSPIAKAVLKGTVSAEDVQQKVREFVKAMRDFTDKLKEASEADLENYENIKTSAQVLREADEKNSNKMLTFYPNLKLSDNQKDCIYEAMAEYIDSSTKYDIGELKIKSTKSAQKYAKDIIDSVSKNIEANTTSKTIRTNAGTVRLNLTGFSRSFSGNIMLNDKLAAAVVSTNTYDIMVDYLENLSKTVNDLMYQTCVSLFKEFADATSLTEFFEDGKAAEMEKLKEDLKKAGYGNLYKTIAAMKEGYGVIEAIDKCSNSKDLEELLKNAETCYEKIRKLRFSDSDLTKIVLKDAETQIDNSKSDLTKILYAYYMNQNPEKMNSIAGKVITKLMVNCPVNFIVYDRNGTEVGRVINGKTSYKPDTVFTVAGSTKTAYMESRRIGKIVFTGTGKGTMNYSVQEIKDQEVVNQANYYNVPLEEGKTYTQRFSSGTVLTNHTDLVAADLKKISESDNNNMYSKPEYVNVNCTAEKGGTVNGGGSVLRGMRTSVEACADKGYTFAGWYRNDELVSTSSTYYFAPAEDLVLIAKFQKQMLLDEGYKAVTADTSQIGLYLVKNENGTGNLSITGAEKEKQNTFVLKYYQSENGSAAKETITLKSNSDGTCIYENLDYSKYKKIEVCDAGGKLLTTLWKKELLQSDLSSLPAALEGDEFRYTGKEICPGVVIEDLEENLDYTVTYKDNINPGKASVVINGIGDYKGSITKTFIIYKDKSEVCGHTNKITSKKQREATCTVDGYTAEIKCADCGKVITKSTVLKAAGHKKVVDRAVAATVFTEGRSAGSHCSVCGKVLKKQTVIAKAAKTIKLSVTSKCIKQTTSFTLKISGMGKGDSVKSVTSSNSSIAKVQKIKTNNYKITGVKKGIAKITVTLRSGKKASCTVKVERRTLSVNKTRVTLSKGKSFLIKVNGSPAVSVSKKTLKFSSSDNKIVVVSASGKITAKKPGTCKIYVKGNGLTRIVTVTVKK